jgi:hypothetical protein
MGLRELMQMQAGLEVGEPETEDVNSIDYLRRIYRDPNQPIAVRMRAAIESLPYENAKITAVAIGKLTGQDFYTRLEKALQASEKAKVVRELKAVEIIEAEAQN